MPRCIYLLVTLGFGWVSTATAVEIGQTWAEVQAELGKPVSQLDAGGRRIARWADLEVTFTDGCVSSQLRRDLASEASSEARRKEEAETTRKLREEIDADNRRREEDREAQEERDRPETERKALAEVDSQMAAIAERFSISYVSTLRVVDYQFAKDFIWNGAYTYSDMDHWSPVGEQVFGERLRREPTLSGLLGVSVDTSRPPLIDTEKRATTPAS